MGVNAARRREHAALCFNPQLLQHAKGGTLGPSRGYQRKIAAQGKYAAEEGVQVHVVMGAIIDGANEAGLRVEHKLHMKGTDRSPADR
jgi:hypothetical protein